MIIRLRERGLAGGSGSATTRLAAGGRGLMADARPAAVFGWRDVVVVAGDRPGQDRLGLPAVIVVDDVGDHHGDVVRAAAAQRQLDQPVGAFGDVGDLQGLQDGLLADRVGQTVGTQQIAVALFGLPHDQRRAPPRGRSAPA